MLSATDLDAVARELHLQPAQVRATTELLDEGNTVPFITRYRKDFTGGLDEEEIRAFFHNPNDYTTPRKLLFGQLAQDKDIEDLLTLAYLNKRAVGQGSGVVLMFLGLSWGIMFALSPTGIIGIVFGSVISLGAIALGYYSYRKSGGDLAGRY